MRATIVTEGSAEVDAESAGDVLLVSPKDLPAAIGWTMKPEGLCRDDVCVPVRDQARLFVDGLLDIGAVASALGRPSVIDAPAGLAAIALPSEQRRRALREQQAPSFTLPDLDGAPHTLEEWHGRKRLLVAFSSW
jgi:hypothetical protein